MDISRTANDFYRQFNSNHVILYVGQNLDDSELKVIARCPWSAVITSREDKDFFTFFQSESRFVYPQYAQTYVKEFNRTKLVLKREKLPILQLFGSAEDVQENDPWGDGDEYAMDCARDMLKLLPDLMDYVNPLVMVGIDSEKDWELMRRCLARLLLSSTSEGAVSLWGVSPEVRSAHADILSALEQKKFEIHEIALAEVIRTRDQETQQEEAEESWSAPDADDDVYYQANQPVTITRGDLLVFKNVGTLLTERTINRVRPLGRIQSQKWFSTFLESSASMGPQWYGYLRQSTFYVKRSFEDALVQLVRQQLRGQGVTGQLEKNRPVILEGHPGSSKSITLGALAYRIYNEHINPVIFISDEHFQGTGNEFEDLDMAIQLLEAKADKETRTLVIWDSSTYRSGIDRAKRLLERLRNRGRRLVLVCSSYDLGNFTSKEDGYFCCSRDGNNFVFVPCGRQDAQLLRWKDYDVVFAKREMDDREQVKFWEVAREYSGISKQIIINLRETLKKENKNEVFDFYYKLISLLRDALEKGLRVEQSKVRQHVKNELGCALDRIKTNAREEKTQSAMYQAFLQAGIDESELEFEEPQTEQLDDDMENRLKTLEFCVALFSRFKLEMSYGLAYMILAGDDENNRYSKATQELFQIASTEIPWLYYGESSKGDYIFRFRNALEADIFLNTHSVSGEQQIDLLYRMIDIYGKDYARNRCKDLEFTDNLQALLRLMGPNSTYAPFRKGREREHNNILKNLDRLIDKVYEIIDRRGYGVPDEDAGFAVIVVTFTREYYGAIWNDMYGGGAEEKSPWTENPEGYTPEDYELRIRKLSDAISLADMSRETIEKSLFSTRNMVASERDHLISQRNSMVVEIAQCNMRLERLAEEYRRCCSDFGEEPDQQIEGRRLSYRVLYHQLLPVIDSDPANGYAYNALFSAFEQMYENERSTMGEEQKLQYLSEIMQQVDTCHTMGDEIRSRGTNDRDELSNHIAKITAYSTKINITLDDICRYRRGEQTGNAQKNAFFTLYDQMLEDGNAAAVTFICQKELHIPKAGKRLNTDERLRCRKVYSFMREEGNFQCVSADAYALAMLIRVTWMLYTGRPLFYRPECQLTSLDAPKWQELHELCEMYNNVAGENYKQPILTLLYALSTLQANSRTEQSYNEALGILKTINEDNFRQPRMFTPFMVCDENGQPYSYAGIVTHIEKNNGMIRINGVPMSVRFHRHNLGKYTKSPELNQGISELELGLGYTGFSVYTQSGRKEREERS